MSIAGFHAVGQVVPVTADGGPAGALNQVSYVAARSAAHVVLRPKEA